MPGPPAATSAAPIPNQPQTQPRYSRSPRSSPSDTLLSRHAKRLYMDSVTKNKRPPRLRTSCVHMLHVAWGAAEDTAAQDVAEIKDIEGGEEKSGTPPRKVTDTNKPGQALCKLKHQGGTKRAPTNKSMRPCAPARHKAPQKTATSGSRTASTITYTSFLWCACLMPKRHGSPGCLSRGPNDHLSAARQRGKRSHNPLAIPNIISHACIGPLTLAGNQFSATVYSGAAL